MRTASPLSTPPRPLLPQLVGTLLAVWWWLASPSPVRADDDLQFFETRVRPVLVQHCDRCHSADAKELKGGLRLDLKSGWQQGGDSGEPAIVPGEPDRSLLLKAVQHAEGVAAMPQIGRAHV